MQNGRVIADVEIANLGNYFVGERALVRIAADKRQAPSSFQVAIASSAMVWIMSSLRKPTINPLRLLYSLVVTGCAGQR